MDGPRGIFFLVGAPGAGKTQVCQRVAALARRKGLRVSGLITEARSLASGRIVQTVVNLRTGERRRLANYVGVDEGEPIGSGVAGRFSWTFIGDSVRWGRHELARCLTSPTNLLIIDQLGPLELVAGSGWANGVEVLRAGMFDVALVVVNPLVVDDLRSRLAPATVTEVQMGPEAHDLLQEPLAALVAGRSGAEHPLLVAGPDVLAADLDGTLIGRGELPPAAIVAGVSEIHSAGATIVICTGRPTTRALPVAEQIAVRRGFLISYGGAETRDLNSHRVLSQVPLHEAAQKVVQRIAANLGLDLSSHDSSAGTLRLVLSGDATQVEHAALAVDESLSTSVWTSRPSPDVLVVQDAAATKKGALAALLEDLGADRARTVYLGDAADDAPALEWAGLGVAVAGESPEAEAAAAVVVTLEAVPELLLQLAQARRLRPPH